MICSNCGKDSAQRRNMTRTYGKGDDLLIIEDVPVMQCKSCGESYMTIETVRELEQLKKDEKKNEEEDDDEARANESCQT